MLIRDIDKEGVNWSDEVDIVVVGAGGAGLIAAITARERGADVVVFERGEEVGGNTILSHAETLAAGTIPQEEAGIEDSAELMASDLLAYTGFDERLTRAISEQSGPAINWLIEEIGVDYRVNTDSLRTGNSVHRSHYPVADDGSVPQTGEPLIGKLVEAAERMGVEVRTNSAVDQLVVDGDEVVGVVTEPTPTPPGELRRRMIRAEKTLLATNGVTGNRELRTEHFPETKGLEYWGSRHLLGDSIQWGKELGATVELSEEGYSAFPLVSQPEGFHIPIDLARDDGAFVVNRDGVRFGNITAVAAPLLFSRKIIQQPKGVAFVVFDQTTYDTLSSSPFAKNRFGRADEIGVFDVGESIEALARKLGVDADSLGETVAEINHAAGDDAPDEFGRERNRPLKAPFYGTKIEPGVVEHKGGLKVNDEAKVLDESGSPIPNLFAGGSVTSGISGLDNEGYIPGTAMITVLALGRIMGETAAAELART